MVHQVWPKICQDEPRKIVTDKLKSYGVAHRELEFSTLNPNFNVDSFLLNWIIDRWVYVLMGTKKTDALTPSVPVQCIG